MHPKKKQTTILILVSDVLLETKHQNQNKIAVSFFFGRHSEKKRASPQQRSESLDVTSSFRRRQDDPPIAFAWSKSFVVDRDTVHDQQQIFFVSPRCDTKKNTGRRPSPNITSVGTTTDVRSGATSRRGSQIHIIPGRDAAALGRLSFFGTGDLPDPRSPSHGDTHHHTPRVCATVDLKRSRVILMTQMGDGGSLFETCMRQISRDDLMVSNA